MEEVEKTLELSGKFIELLSKEYYFDRMSLEDYLKHTEIKFKFINNYGELKH